MLPFGLEGFYNAPITKISILTVSLLSLLASIFNYKKALHLQIVPHMTRHHQFWRICTHTLAFANSGELLIGSLMLYNMRIIERSFGSLKFSSMLVISAAVSTLFSLLSLGILAPIGIRYIPAGPFGIIFSIFYQYHRIIPPTYRFRLFGLTITDKSFIWFFASQLMLSQFPQSFVACVCGLAAGMFYRSDLTGIKKWRLPLFIQKLAGHILPLIGSIGLPSRSTATTREELHRLNIGSSSAISISQNGQTVTRRVNLPNTSGENTTSPGRTIMREYLDTLSGQGDSIQVPRETDITLLEELFPNANREQIVRSLQATNFDVNAAVGVLLQQLS